MSDRITIIFGPNGFGKTFLLSLVDALFNGRYQEFYRIPFRELAVAFDDDSTLSVTKEPYEGGERLIVRHGDEVVTTEPSQPPTDDLLWLRNLSDAVNVHLINTERLLGSTGAAVRSYSSELRERIEESLADYAALSHSLDRTFPRRLISGGAGPESSLECLKVKLRELEKKRQRLTEAGILDRDEVEINELNHISEENRNVLSIYLGDMEKKLGIFDELAEKIELLVKIINSMFLHKHMEITRKDGFVFIDATGKHLLPEHLSSGEQHAIVLLCELLFKIESDSLILIDEPELSLHVFWQQQFLKDIEEIIRIAAFDVLIATHSPQIIHDRWDLAVELKGPENEALY